MGTQALRPPLLPPPSSSSGLYVPPPPPENLTGLMWLMGGAGTGDDLTAELSPARSEAASRCPARPCAGPPAPCNPGEMKGAAAHWPGDYSAALSRCQDTAAGSERAVRDAESPPSSPAAPACSLSHSDPRWAAPLRSCSRSDWPAGLRSSRLTAYLAS